MKTIFNVNFKTIALLMAIMLTVGSLYMKANTRIEGRIMDGNNSPLPYATATIIDPETNEIVKGDMTDENGKFIIENVKPGYYTLSFRLVGYETDEIRTLLIPENTGKLNAGKIVMNEMVVMLSEVVVHPESINKKNVVL